MSSMCFNTRKMTFFRCLFLFLYFQSTLCVFYLHNLWRCLIHLIFCICLSFYILSNSRSANGNPPQSPPLSNTITAWRELITRLGCRPPFPTPSSCSAAAVEEESSLQRLYQVKQEHKVSYRCSLPSPLQKRFKYYEELH